ncbi:hypothetical protein EVAR_3982_1 [Eumeta japonica]|uniref:Uncharacterized protein n=1 Tax=Eumeta variegata TaxID=151549 RepID=A0A4C1STL4_EUMVA|nr:hypothetical protein EVAR_3982_1 [Eumeta japonica]
MVFPKRLEEEVELRAYVTAPTAEVTGVVTYTVWMRSFGPSLNDKLFVHFFPHFEQYFILQQENVALVSKAVSVAFARRPRPYVVRALFVTCSQHFNCFQGVLRELEQKKPQLDELLHTAESLKGTENRQQLHGKGNLSVQVQTITPPLQLRPASLSGGPYDVVKSWAPSVTAESKTELESRLKPEPRVEQRSKGYR